VIKRLICSVAAVIVTLATGVPAAHAQTMPDVAVTPSTGLVDGQSVSVTASGFIAFVIPTGDTFVPTAFECAPEFPPSATVDLQTAFDVVEPLLNEFCHDFGEFPVTESTVTSLTISVARSFVTRSGGSVTCGSAPGDCLIVAAGASPGSVVGVASAPITFGPLTPQTRRDCTKGGWRAFADAHGERFKNQGTCVAFVEHEHHTT
jgi:hypothetical protein